ncbi:hypothetical protein BU26DRAFT_175766 [Trematosphaeria pertusa]|uniref:Uncharacterized protein n=1 Tax=Trematosphaeria pertusa TaxID=390896 RepID=A0A6A6HTR9_9PLEO|nr:uncharacterized protein BU26DRAFT_175766 [Trematosphaeria pertusa]KAF2241309.1 hypothetical protein BU26DRAFT_175766 [Trematosphaeria pertusa]
MYVVDGAPLLGVSIRALFRSGPMDIMVGTSMGLSGPLSSSMQLNRSTFRSLMWYTVVDAPARGSEDVIIVVPVTRSPVAFRIPSSAVTVNPTGKAGSVPDILGPGRVPVPVRDGGLDQRRDFVVAHGQGGVRDVVVTHQHRSERDHAPVRGLERVVHPVVVRVGGEGGALAAVGPHEQTPRPEHGVRLGYPGRYGLPAAGGQLPLLGR